MNFPSHTGSDIRVLPTRFGRLEAIVFAAGIAVLVVEIGGARVLSTYFGDTLFTWTSSIFVVLASLAFGYYAGGIIADKRPEMKLLSFFLFAAAIFICAAPFISQVVLNYSLTFGYEFGPLFASLFLFAAPNVFLGMVSPFAVRIKTKGIEVVGKSAGNLYAISTAGSIAGALLSGYLLIPFLGVSESFFLMSLMLVVVGVSVFGVKSVPLVAIALVPFLVSSPQIYNFRSYGTVIYQSDTPYYHLEVIKVPGLLLLVTSLPGVQTDAYANLTDPRSLDYYGYQSILYYGPNEVKSALYLGLGGGSMISDLYQNTNSSIDVVEIDPVVISVAEKYFGISNNSRIKVYNQDARFFLRNSTKKYDMIVLDAYGQSLSLPYFLVSEEAAREMESRLNPNGSVFINLISPIEGNNAGIFKSVYNTFNSVFPNLYFFALNSNHLNSMQNIEVIASTNTTRRSASDFMNELKGKINQEEIISMLYDYYNSSVNTTAYPILTDDRNALDNYAASAVSKE
ncbi:MAG: fused MFS/spermidine synthase [Candidatus Micrarchaeales archaeon]